MCYDVNYDKPKSIKPSLVICIAFPLPTKINRKGVAFHRETSDKTETDALVSMLS